MPINRRWNVEELLSACREYIQKTGRRISFEYTVVEGINDSPACAVELAGRLRGMLCHVNLIPLNPIKRDPQADQSYLMEPSARMPEFLRGLEQAGIQVSLRNSRGSDIDGACGQLIQNSRASM